MTESLFSTEQVQYLRAMGLPVYMLQVDEPAVAATPAPSVVKETPAEMVVKSVAAPSKPQAPKPAVPKLEEPVAAPVRPSTRHALPPGSPLERDLLAATGRTRRSEARAMLDTLGIHAATLRGDAAAKRAAWIALRPLRPKRR